MLNTKIQGALNFIAFDMRIVKADGIISMDEWLRWSRHTIALFYVSRSINLQVWRMATCNCVKQGASMTSLAAIQRQRHSTTPRGASTMMSSAPTAPTKPKTTRQSLDSKGERLRPGRRAQDTNRAYRTEGGVAHQGQRIGPDWGTPNHAPELFEGGYIGEWQIRLARLLRLESN